ncbi:MAG: hypothetical protein KF774_17780 [Planctomyces sp.]|nr:hypothetical protein [Planctomyces sp.]
MQMGFKCHIYRNTGTYGSPTWSLFDEVTEVTLNLEMGEADVTTRADNGFTTTEPSLQESSLEFEIKADHANTNFVAIRNAFLQRTALDMQALDGLLATEGSQGLRARWKVFSFTRNETLEEAVTYSVTMRPCKDPNPPVWVEIEDD